MKIQYFENEIQLHTAAADLIVGLTDKALQESRPFLFALSGGNSPLKLYSMLAVKPYKNKICRDAVHFFFSDERMVPPDNPQSNYYNACEHFFKKGKIKGKSVHRIKGELSTAETASKDYEKHLMKFFDLPEGEWPVFDLILSGLGKDGHTASLFPGDPAVYEKKHWVIPVENSNAEPLIPRVSLSLPVLNSARNVLFLVNRAGKEEILERILNQEYGKPETTFPAAMIKPQGNLYWYILK